MIKNKENKKQKEKSQEGITVKKNEDFSEWYTQVLEKAELIEYTSVSGAYIIRPRAYFIWEKVKDFFDDKIKKDGVRNAMFPLFIPKSNLMKEQDHVEGFTPEVAWVTQSGSTELKEPLAIRPTSETIFYPAYSKWIRSHRDLPLRLNQWCNVVRWEFNNPVPFIRAREFLWQEGHSVFETKEEAAKEVSKIRDFYEDIYKDMYALPVIKGKKTEKEKFAGADHSLTTEIILPHGKAAQGATAHLLGQSFAKAFDISYMDKNEKKQFPWQTSWGISTRSIGIAILMHSDDRGSVLSPQIAETQAVIVPIFKKNAEKEKIESKAEEIKHNLNKKGFRAIVDDREYSPGYKFNDWEMKGVPLRIEIGPKDLEKDQAILVRRDNKDKQETKINKIDSETKKIFEDIHKNLYQKAEKVLNESIVEASTMDQVIETINNQKIAKTYWDGTQESEDWIKEKTGGAKIICISEEDCVEKDAKGVYSGNSAKHVVYIGKSY